MEKKEYLNEEKYQKVVKKISMLSVVILAVGFFIGGGLIAYGFIKSNETNIPEVVQEEEKSEVDIQAEIEALREELVPLSGKIDEEFKVNGFSREFSKLIDQREGILLKMNDLKAKTTDASKAFDSFMDKREKIENKVKVAPYYMIGGFILFASFIVSFMIFLIAKKRDITAFSVQQSLPIAKEGLEEMAPTFGEVGKEIAKGIKEGSKEE